MTLPFHPLACVFPLIEGEEFIALVNDIRGNGLLDPIDVFEGAVLDGRNRQRACEEAHVPCWYRDFTGSAEEALAYVVAKNLNRRHLNDGQRAYVAARLAGFGWGGDRSKSPDGDLKTDAAARLVNVKRRQVDRARVIRDKGIEALQAMVERGALEIATAERVAKLPDEDQRLVLQANDPRRVCAELKKRMRARRELELSDKQVDLPKAKFGVILADPEWRFEPFSRETGMDRAADNHYSTSATAVIAARPVADIAADACCLFLWATVPMLPDALQVMEAWGFTYKSHAIWNKDRIGTGYWFRNKHELLLVGTKGNIPAPAMGEQWASVVDAPVGRHSAKPEIFLEMIEAYFPTLPKIELNRRGPARKGWAAWGDQAEPGEYDPSTGEIPDGIHSGRDDGPDHRGNSGDGAGNGFSDHGDLGLPQDQRMAGSDRAKQGEDDNDLLIPDFLKRTRDNKVPEANVVPLPQEVAFE